MRELLKIVESFSVSRPIFKVSKDRHGNLDIDLMPEMRYRPTPDDENPLSELTCTQYKEYFSTKEGKFKYDKNAIAQTTMSMIRSSMSRFLERNLEMKSPRQSKIYRWYYRNLPDSNEFNDTLVMVYKYLRTFCNKDMKSTGDKVEHINNAIALLDAIMVKYEER